MSLLLISLQTLTFSGIPGKATFLKTASQRQRIGLVLSKAAAHNSKVWFTNVRSQWRNSAWALPSYCGALNTREPGYLFICKIESGNGPEFWATPLHIVIVLAWTLLRFWPKKGSTFLDKCLGTGHRQAGGRDTPSQYFTCGREEVKNNFILLTLHMTQQLATKPETKSFVSFLLIISTDVGLVPHPLFSYQLRGTHSLILTS